MVRIALATCIFLLGALGAHGASAQGFWVSVVSPGDRGAPPRPMPRGASPSGKIVVVLPVALGFPNYACVDVHVMSTLARMTEEGASLGADLSLGVSFVCENYGTRFDRWPRSGERALLHGTRWSYPNGNRASFGSAWYYPDGTVARSSTGHWSYPNGERALRSDGTWYSPDGTRIGKLQHPQEDLVIVGILEQMWRLGRDGES